MNSIMGYTWALTTSSKATASQIAQAQRLAADWAVAFLPRQKQSLAKVKAAADLDYLVVLDQDNRLFMADPPLHWHPSMAVPRLRQLSEGKTDVFLAAADIAPGDQVLDCTLGLAGDALLAAWVVGEGGRVMGLEASPVVAAITAWGLTHEAARYQHKKTPIATLAERIEVNCADAMTYLGCQRDCSWDVIYFDPMFQWTDQRSASMNNLRPVACYIPLDYALLTQALRVAKKRVILKERWFSPLFQQLGAHRVHQTKYGPVSYGIWEKEEG